MQVSSGTDVHRSRRMRELVRAKRGLEQYGSRSASEGADTAVWLASTPEAQGLTGRLFEQGSEIPCELRDDAAEERLHEVCYQLARRLERQP